MRKWIVLAALLIVGTVNAGIYDNPDGIDPSASAKAPSFTKDAKVAGWTDQNFCVQRSNSYASCTRCADAILAGSGDESVWRSQRVACVVSYFDVLWCSEERNPAKSPDGDPWNIYDLLGLPQPKKAPRPRA